VAAAATLLVLLLGGSLGLTEATGVTRVASTILRVFTPDGTLVVEVDDPQVKVTIEGDGGLLITGAGPQEVRLRPGTYRWTATREGRVTRTDLLTLSQGGKQQLHVHLEPSLEALAAGSVRRMRGHGQRVHAVAFASGGKLLLSGGADSCIRIWDVATGKELRLFEGHQISVWAVKVSPDGRHVLSSSGGEDSGSVVDWSVCLWEAETCKELHRHEGHGMAMTALSFSADGKRALFANFDGTVRLWDVETWKETRRFQAGLGVWSVDFSPDGSASLLAGGAGGRPGWFRALGPPGRAGAAPL
jgi:WD40 repeat protein